MAKRFKDVLKEFPLDAKAKQLLQVTHDFELELIKKAHELELLKKDHDHQVKKLKTELSAANWENLKQLKYVELRSFIDEFDDKKLDKTISTRAERFADFAMKNVDLLKACNLEVDHFMKIFRPLYSKLCDSAHPIFRINNTVQIDSFHLEQREIRLLGFLWEAYPLPLDKLLIRSLAK